MLLIERDSLGIVLFDLGGVVGVVGVVFAQGADLISQQLVLVLEHLDLLVEFCSLLGV